ncbi:hypothetical protein HDU93_005336, partial [Gonapodya sp. JEL0774]
MIRPDSARLSQPPPQVVSTLPSDDWSLIPQAVDTISHSTSSEVVSDDVTALDVSYPPVVPLPDVPVVEYAHPRTASAPVPPSESIKGKEKVSDDPMEAEVAEGTTEPMSDASAPTQQQVLDRITEDLQKAMDHCNAIQVNLTQPSLEAQVAPPSFEPFAGGAPILPSAESPAQQAYSAPTAMPMDLSASFNRVVDELVHAVQLLAVTTAGGARDGRDDEATRQERDRVTADLMRDVGVLVEQLRVTLTRSATVLYAQVQSEVSRVVSEIRTRAAASHAEL